MSYNQTNQPNIHGQVGKLFANGSGDWGSVPGWVMPKTKKNGTWYLLV